jgi:ribose-phosphate pyrophosphokinase
MSSDANSLKIFAGRHSIELAERACDHIHLPLGQARTTVFPDGELMVKLEEDVRGRDCFVVISTCQPVNDNLMELLIFLDSLSRASASRVTVVTPYFGYARQDRKDEGRTPITAKLVANLTRPPGPTALSPWTSTPPRSRGSSTSPSITSRRRPSSPTTSAPSARSSATCAW